MKKSCNEFKLKVEISADLQKGGCLSNESYIPIAKARFYDALDKIFLFIVFVRL